MNWDLEEEKKWNISLLSSTYMYVFVTLTENRNYFSVLIFFAED